MVDSLLVALVVKVCFSHMMMGYYKSELRFPMGVYQNFVESELVHSQFDGLLLILFTDATYQSVEFILEIGTDGILSLLSLDYLFHNADFKLLIGRFGISLVGFFDCAD
eukprot:TRINITY_DN81979_c0_g1_i1.p1 TRINITY_DN81979_c0_g1~~TRINITY_DN81979_c0_g1_i1.p1  ORF type:complete len:109 (-),score=3.09 TRINITY_DN81979_c0_g1_i1:48-374(-)